MAFKSKIYFTTFIRFITDCRKKHWQSVIMGWTGIIEVHTYDKWKVLVSAHNP